MLKREDITEELLEKYKDKKPNSLEEFFSVSEKNRDYKIDFIESLIDLKKSLNELSFTITAKGDEKYRFSQILIPNLYKEKIIIKITNIFEKYGSLLQGTFLEIQEKYFSKRIKLKENFIKTYSLFFYKMKIRKPFLIQGEDLKKELENLFLILIKNASETINLIRNNETLDKETFNSIDENLIMNFENIIKLAFLFGVEREEIYDEKLKRIIMKEENLYKIKTHKLLRYSNFNFELKESFKEYFTNKVLKVQKLNEKYPNIEEWIEKVYKEIEEDNRKREIFIFINSNSNFSSLNIEGIAILKNTEEEKKICYLYIANYEDMFNIYEEIYNFLEVETPLLTIEKELFIAKYIKFLRKLKNESGKAKLKFNLTSIVPDKYIKGKTELIFNEDGKETINIGNNYFILGSKSIDDIINEIIADNSKKVEE